MLLQKIIEFICLFYNPVSRLYVIKQSHIKVNVDTKQKNYTFYLKCARILKKKNEIWFISCLKLDEGELHKVEEHTFLNI